MTLPTALELIRRQDLNATLAAARRQLTEADRRAFHDLKERAAAEDSAQAVSSCR